MAAQIAAKKAGGLKKVDLAEMRPPAEEAPTGANLADLLSNAMNTRRVAMANNGGNEPDDDSDSDWDDD